jgi:hypothetical protein
MNTPDLKENNLFDCCIKHTGKEEAVSINDLFLTAKQALY